MQISSMMDELHLIIDYVNRIRTLDAMFRIVITLTQNDSTKPVAAQGRSRASLCGSIRFRHPRKNRCSFLAPMIRSLCHDASRHSWRTFEHLPEMVEYMNQGNIHCSREVRKGRGACDQVSWNRATAKGLRSEGEGRISTQQNLFSAEVSARHLSLLRQ